jgi:AraC family transcriptional regulator
VIHYGSPVEIGCERGDHTHSGTSIHGDIDIVPAGIASKWILKSQDTALIVRISKDLLRNTAMEMGMDPASSILRNRFQIRDPKIEYLGWALKADMENGFPGGRLFTEGVGVAIACHLLRAHSVATSNSFPGATGAISVFRLRRALIYIENNLSESLSLAAIAEVSGLSLSQCQRTFRRATGLSIHQYVIQRRAERAKTLLLKKDLSISEVASTVGFASQSHLSFHMRRLFGSSPMSLRRRGLVYSREMRRSGSA